GSARRRVEPVRDHRPGPNRADGPQRQVGDPERHDPRPAGARAHRPAAPRRQAGRQVDRPPQPGAVQEYLHQRARVRLLAMADDAIAGKIAVVTGGATGIGKAVATRLAAAGAKVVIAGRDHVRGKTSAQDLARQGYEVKFLRTDVRIENAINTLFDYALDMYG